MCGIDAVLVSRLVSALALGIPVVLIGVFTISAAANAVVSRLVALLIEVDAIPVPVIRGVVHGPVIASGIYATVALWWLVPDSRIERVLEKHPTREA